MALPCAAPMPDSASKPAAVLFLAFNRPDLLERVLERLQGTDKRKVFVSIDGPRPDRPAEREQCERVREVIETIGWASELHVKAEETNLGCGPAVSSAISWALREVPEIIVIEDDCLPHPTFLSFCDELLHRYRHDERIMHIGGTNWGADARRYAGYSYAFTSFAPIWGWATWRRAWDLYDYELESWPRVKRLGLASGMAVSPRFRRLLERDWDLRPRGMGNVGPSVAIRGYASQRTECVTRIQHGDQHRPASRWQRNCKAADRILSSSQLEEIEFPLRHPPEVVRNASVESVFERVYWQKFGWPGRLYRSLTNERIRQIIRPLVPRPS